MRRTFCFLLYYLPRGDSFSGFVNAIIAYSGKVSPPFLLSWKFISSLFYRALTDIRDNLSRISRDKGVVSAALDSCAAVLL